MLNKEEVKTGMNKVTCAWCGVTLRTDSPVADSHGICEECKKRLLKELKEEEIKEMTEMV